MATILAILRGILEVIPIINKWFPKKTPTEQSQDDAARIKEETDRFRRTGRPSQ